MTAQSKLEALAGRALTSQETAWVDARSSSFNADAELAASLSVGRNKVMPTLIGEGQVLIALGPENGAAFLDSMEALAATNSPVKWAMKLLSQGQLDIGLAMTRDMVSKLFPAEAANQLLALAVFPEPILETQVTTILDEV